VGDKRDQGAAYVFYRGQGGADHWGRVAQLIAADGAVEDSFGFSVSINGDTLVVGVPSADMDGSCDQGAAYVFSRDQGGINHWGQVKKLTAADGAAGDRFGSSVSVSGDTLVVAGGGAAYAFYRNPDGADQWDQVKKMTAPDGKADSLFGFSVSLSADTLVVGMPLAFRWPCLPEGRAAAYIFQRSRGGTDNWGLIKKVVGSDVCPDSFGWSVSVSGDTLVVGAPDRAWKVSWGPGGAYYVFVRNQGGTENWGRVEELFPPELSIGFAYFVSVSENTIVVGEPHWRSLIPSFGAGAAYAYGLFARGVYLPACLRQQ
jgi:hypothetical protein